MFEKGYRSGFEQLLNGVKIALDPIRADLVLRETYDEEFDVYSTSEYAESPYATVGMHPVEDPTLVDPFDTELDRYIGSNVLKYTGVTFDSFMGATRYKADKIMARCHKLSAAEAEEAAKLLADKQNQVNRPKPHVPVRDRMPQRKK